MTHQIIKEMKKAMSTSILLVFRYAIFIHCLSFVIEDGVFLNNESQRKEYVLNEQGVIYNGETDNVSQRPWNYGQVKIREP